VDDHERGESREFGLRRDELGQPINIKVASTVFRKTGRVVGSTPRAASWWGL